MKSTEHFKKTILSFLKDKANSDQAFAARFAIESKNIDDCITYILNTVQKSGCNGFSDEEIFGMALHYYDEDKITIGKPVSCDVVVNHTIELSKEEKERMKQKAIEDYMKEEREKLKQNRKKRVEKQSNVAQQSLF